jgi:Zinc-binding dehydrogenase
MGKRVGALCGCLLEGDSVSERLELGDEALGGAGGVAAAVVGTEVGGELADDAGHLRPLIDTTFPFDQTLEALAYVEQGRANGKVVITLD